MMKKEIVNIRIDYIKRTQALQQSLIIINQVALLYNSGNEELIESIDNFKKYVDEKSLIEKNNVTIYVEYQIGLIFLQLISEIEYNLYRFMKAVLKRYPKKMGNINFNLSEILQHKSNDEIIDKAINRFLNEMMYKKPNDYKTELAQIISCSPNDFDTYWPKYVEMKARRDLGVHNNWRVNEIYLRKLKEVGTTLEVDIDDLLQPDFIYFDSSIQCGDKLMKFIYEHLINKFN